MSLKRTHASRCCDDTIALGVVIGRALQGGECVALIGPLGAGKTQLVKGIASGAGSADADDVTSPTYVLMNEYAGRVRLHHIDAYRLRTAHELTDLGIDDILDGGGCTLIEWADRFPAALPSDRLTIEFTLTGVTDRLLTLAADGPRSRALLAGLADTR